MAVDSVNPVNKISLDYVKEQYQKSSDKKLFADALANAIKDLDDNVDLTDKGVEKLLMGEDTDLDELLINMQKTEMTLDLTLQIREKLIDAYKEIMRMQI